MTVTTLKHKIIDIPNLTQINSILDAQKSSINTVYLPTEGGYVLKNDARVDFPDLTGVVGKAGRTYGRTLTRSNSYVTLTYTALGDYFGLNSNDRFNAQDLIILYLRTTSSPNYLGVRPGDIDVNYTVADKLTVFFPGNYQWETQPSIELFDLLTLQINIHKC